MNRSTRRSSAPGTGVLFLARRLFAEQIVSAVFVPAVADFQGELRDASARRLTHFVARCRWYWALTVLLVVTPFSVSIPSIDGRGSLTRAAGSGWMFVVLYGCLLAGAWWCVQEFTVAAIVAGLALACAMRAWNDRHPAVSAIHADTIPFVQINLSTIPVPADAAGLMFAAGTILIVVIGLPGLSWFFVAAALGSLLVAWQRYTRHSPTLPLVANSISVR
jgi:hypothetical protein